MAVEYLFPRVKNKQCQALAPVPLSRAWWGKMSEGLGFGEKVCRCGGFFFFKFHDITMRSHITHFHQDGLGHLVVKNL